MHYILIGVQGCGKGTQAKRLVENFGFSTFSTGDALRNHVKEGTEIGKEAEAIMKEGGLVNDVIIGKIVSDFLNKDTTGKVLFDGIPRNSEQKIMFDSLVPEYKVIFFELSEEISRKRLLGRMFDPESNETFVSGTEINPVTGTKLIKRKDDNEEAISKRIDLFYNETMPIVKEYENEGRVIMINANQPIEDVTNEIKEKLGL